MKTQEEIKQFFFTAMLGGWAASGKKIAIPSLPGYEAIEFREGDLRLLDCWCVNGNRSTGFTTIWERDVPRWVMHYGGEYVPEVMSTLKDALLTAYRERKFKGGRGPAFFNSAGPFEYVNTVQQTSFHEFSGREVVRNAETGAVYGFHDYWGMYLGSSTPKAVDDDIQGVG